MVLRQMHKLEVLLSIVLRTKALQSEAASFGHPAWNGFFYAFFPGRDDWTINLFLFDFQKDEF